MALERFVKSVQGDHLPTGDHMNKPFYIKPVAMVEGLITKHDATGESRKIRVHAVDMENDKVYANAVLFNSALVDGLEKYLGSATVGIFYDQRNKSGSGEYRNLKDGSDADYAKAEANMEKYDAAIEARIAELEAESGAAEAPAKSAGAFKR